MEMGWFADKKTEAIKFQLVEVERPRQIPPQEAEVSKSIATLQGHPGFQYLVEKLRLQRAQLKTALCNQRQENLKDVEFLQSGIAWTGWLEEQLMRAVNHQEPKPQEPAQTEQEAFEEIQRFIEVLK
jgi:hypothetical protein